MTAVYNTLSQILYLFWLIIYLHIQYTYLRNNINLKKNTKTAVLTLLNEERTELNGSCENLNQLQHFFSTGILMENLTFKFPRLS